MAISLVIQVGNGTSKWKRINPENLNITCYELFLLSFNLFRLKKVKSILGSLDYFPITCHYGCRIQRVLQF